MAETVVTLPALERFKARQDEANASKFALKGETAGIATADRAGIVKPGSDFDVAADGTLTMYQPMAINSMGCSPSTAERGSTVDDVALTWSLSKTPASLELDGEAQDASSKGATLTGAGISANRTFSLAATDARGAKATKTAGISFLDKRHWFTGAYSAADLTDAVLNAATGELATSRAKAFSVNAAAGQRIFYAFPHSWGTPRFFVGGFEGGFSLLKTFDHVNASGATVSYDVYMSANAGLGSTSVEVR